MTCQEMIMSNDYLDIIWKIDTSPGASVDDLDGMCTQYINRNFSVIYRSVDETIQNLGKYPLGDYGLPACHTPLDTDSLEAANILSIQNQPALQLKGNGVILGFLDSGISLENPVFRTVDGRTRVLELWDQTDQSGLTPNGIDYGSVYSAREINGWLEEGRTDLPGKDVSGHGTKVAAIAAGSPMPENDFIGAAPESSIVFVKLKEAKPIIRSLQHIPQNSVAYEESDIMLGIRYLDMVAKREDRPLVICIALGSNMGGHTGSTPLGFYLQDFSGRVGRAAVVPAGNEGNKGHHFFGVVPDNPGYLDVELRVGEAEEAEGFQMNLWGNAPGMFSAEVISPSGERVPRLYPRVFERQSYDFVFENTTLLVQYELSEFTSGDERLLFSFDKPTPGIWRFRVYSSENLENSFHIWLPVTGFISDGTYFLKPDPDTTITEPANAPAAITIAGYDGKNSSLWLDSGRGYTRNGRLKPDIAAPADGVSTIDRFGRSSTLTGTSASAALAAGAAALLMEWGIVRGNLKNMDSVVIQRFLIRGAQRPLAFEYPNRNWGYGILDLYGSFRALRGSWESF